MAREHMAEADGILQGHAGALGARTEHWVCSIPQDRDAPVDPRGHGIAVAQDPALPVAAVLHDLLRARMNMGEPAPHLFQFDRLPGNGLAGSLWQVTTRLKSFQP